MPAIPAWSAEPLVELLWPEGAPGALGDEPKDKPTLTLWLPAPERATGAAIVVCPGGGYGHLAVDHEGSAGAIFDRFSKIELPMTDSELAVMAMTPIIGCSRRMAAMGMAARL